MAYGENKVLYYRNEFLRRRAFYARKTNNKGSIEIEEIMSDAYVEECTNAARGDEIAMDLLSYWFKHSNPVLDENVETSYKWLFCAGAHGNIHSISKLSLFFNYAYDYLLEQDYSEELIKAKEIYKENYQEILGVDICAFMVEDLHIDMLELAKERTANIDFNALSMRKFTQSLNRCLPRLDAHYRKLLGM